MSSGRNRRTESWIRLKSFEKCFCIPAASVLLEKILIPFQLLKTGDNLSAPGTPLFHHRIFGFGAPEPPLLVLRKFRDCIDFRIALWYCIILIEILIFCKSTVFDPSMASSFFHSDPIVKSRNPIIERPGECFESNGHRGSKGFYRLQKCSFDRRKVLR